MQFKNEKGGEMKKNEGFKFGIGEIVSHKLGTMQLLIIQQQTRTNTGGGFGKWYLCRLPNMTDTIFAEIELEKFKEIKRYKVDVNEWTQGK